MGLISAWNISFLGYPARALLPYCQVRAGGALRCCLGSAVAMWAE